MMKSKSDLLLKNTFIYTIGNFGSKLLSFALVPIYSFYLTKADLGYYDLILTSLSLAVPFITLQIADAAYRWLVEEQEDEQKKKAAVTNGIALLGLNSLVFCVIFMIASLFINLQHPVYIFFIMLVGCVQPFLMQTVRGLGKSTLYSMGGIVNIVLVLFFNILFLYLSKMTLETLLLSMILANVITLAWIVFKSGLLSFVDTSLFSMRELKSMVRYSWPLIPNTISWWLINEVNRFIILYSMGASANGVFAIANKFPSIIIIVNSIFMLSWQDHAMSTLHEKGKEEMNSKIFNTYMVLEFTMVIFLTTVSKFMVTHLIGNAYFDAWRYMPVLYLSVAFSSFSGFFGVAYLGAKKTSSVFTTSLYGSLVNIAVTFLLIKEIGLFAPAVGSALGFLVMYAVRLYQTRSFFKVHVNYPLFFLLLGLSILFIWLAFLDNKYVEIISVVAALLIGIVFNRELVAYLFSFSRKMVKRFNFAS